MNKKNTLRSLRFDFLALCDIKWKLDILDIENAQLKTRAKYLQRGKWALFILGIL